MPQQECKFTSCSHTCNFDPSQLPAPQVTVQCSHPDVVPGQWSIKAVCHTPATYELIREVSAPSIPPIGSRFSVFPNVHGYINWRVVDIQIYAEMGRAILHCVGDDSNFGEITTPK